LPDMLGPTNTVRMRGETQRSLKLRKLQIRRCVIMRKSKVKTEAGSCKEKGSWAKTAKAFVDHLVCAAWRNPFSLGFL